LNNYCCFTLPSQRFEPKSVQLIFANVLSHKRIGGKDRRSEHLFTISNELGMLELYAERWSIGVSEEGYIN